MRGRHGATALATTAERERGEECDDGCDRTQKNANRFVGAAYTSTDVLFGDAQHIGHLVVLELSHVAQFERLLIVLGQLAQRTDHIGVIGIETELVFERGSMRIRNARARVLGYELHSVNGGIKDLMHEQVLELEGQGRGPLPELLRYLKLSPVGEWIGGGLREASPWQRSARGRAIDHSHPARLNRQKR